MIDEISNLLLDYDNKYVDENYYLELNNILVKYYNISDVDYYGITLLTREQFREKFNCGELASELFSGGFYEKDKKIYIIPSNIQHGTKTNKNHYFTIEEDFLFYNLLSSIIFFHEFEHLLQYIGKTGLEGKITNNCPSTLKDDEYAISPREHFANLYSNLIVYFIAKKLNLPQSALNEYIKRIRISLIDPYFYNGFDKKRKNKSLNEPIIEFYNKINVPLPFDYNILNNLPLLERFVLGLALTNEEYEYCIKASISPEEIIEIIRKNFNNDILKEKQEIRRY